MYDDADTDTIFAASQWHSYLKPLFRRPPFVTNKKNKTKIV